MKRVNPKSILILAILLLIVCRSFGFSSFPNISCQKIQSSYSDVASQAAGFIAITNNSRIDWISDKGEITKSKSFDGESFKSLLINNQELIVLGLHGQILFFKNDSSFHTIENHSGNSFKCLTLFKNKIIVGCENGELCFGYDGNYFESLKLKLKGSIVSLSSSIKDCYGVTDQGEIIHTNDGINWTIFDFNSVYHGYYKTCTFIKVETTPNQIAVIGKNDEGLPVLFFSSKGNVWSERPLIYNDEQGFKAQLSEIPNDIYYDSLQDQFILLCSNGLIMSIPSCSHCNKLYKITDKKLYGISGNEHVLILVGDDNFIKTINADTL